MTRLPHALIGGLVVAVLGLAAAPASAQYVPSVPAPAIPPYLLLREADGSVDPLLYAGVLQQQQQAEDLAEQARRQEALRQQAARAQAEQTLEALTNRPATRGAGDPLPPGYQIEPQPSRSRGAETGTPSLDEVAEMTEAERERLLYELLSGDARSTATRGVATDAATARGVRGPVVRGPFVGGSRSVDRGGYFGGDISP